MHGTSFLCSYLRSAMQRTGYTKITRRWVSQGLVPLPGDVKAGAFKKRCLENLDLLDGVLLDLAKADGQDAVF